MNSIRIQRIFRAIIGGIIGGIIGSIIAILMNNIIPL
jgi:gas vesicle protein